MYPPISYTNNLTESQITEFLAEKFFLFFFEE